MSFVASATRRLFSSEAASFRRQVREVRKRFREEQAAQRVAEQEADAAARAARAQRHAQAQAQAATRREAERALVEDYAARRAQRRAAYAQREPSTAFEHKVATKAQRRQQFLSAVEETIGVVSRWTRPVVVSRFAPDQYLASRPDFEPPPRMPKWRGFVPPQQQRKPNKTHFPKPMSASDGGPRRPRGGHYGR